MAKNRVQRPGTQQTTTPARGGGGGGGNNRAQKQRQRERERARKQAQRQKDRTKASAGATDDTEGLTETSPIESNAPIVPFSDSMYGYTGSVPYLNTDEGITAADLDPEGYLTYLHGRKGFSSPGTIGGAQPFNQWLMNERYPALVDAYKAAHLVNPNLNFVQYMQTMGVPADAANHTAGYQPPMGTGQAVDTGNPFTSSSGIGAPAVPKATDMPAHLQAASPYTVPKTAAAATTPTNPFNKKKRPNAYKRWKKNNPAQPAPGPNTTYNPPSGAGGSQTNLGLAALKDREAFLGMSPELRGEKAVDSYSGRWSPWG